MSDTTVRLVECFSSVPDPRSRFGKRHPPEAILTLCSVAMLCGGRSVFAAAQFGRDRGERFAAALGFTRERTPRRTTPHTLFGAPDVPAFGRALARRTSRVADARGWAAVAPDGKTLCGSTDVRLPGVHPLAAYAHEADVVPRQLPVDATTNGHGAAVELPDLIPVKGKVVTGDAMFRQRDPSREIRAKQGDYVWTVEDDQPELLAAIEGAFDDADTSPVAGQSPVPAPSAARVGRGRA